MTRLNNQSAPQTTTTKILQIKTPKPIYWKQVLITTSAVYPLLLLAGWFLRLVFPMEVLKQEVTIFFMVLVVASLMVFPVMPFIMKFVGPWMHKRTGILDNSLNKKIESNIIATQSPLLDTKTVRLDKSGLNIRFAELGDKTKPPLILLHGVPENLQAWYAVAPLMAKQYNVFAIDWPGFGGSDPMTSTKDYTSLNFAEVVIDFLDSLQIQKAILMATDISLLPALLVGLKYPDRVLKLAVMDGIPFPRPQYSSWELRSFANKGSIIGKALVEWFPKISAQIAYFKGFYWGHSIPLEIRQEFSADGISKSTQQAFLSYFQNFHISQQYFEEHVQEMKVPALVIWGKNDRFINPKLAYEIAEKLPNAKLEIIDKAGHYIHMDKPQELVKVVSKFLKE